MTMEGVDENRVKGVKRLLETEGMQEVSAEGVHQKLTEQLTVWSDAHTLQELPAVLTDSNGQGMTGWVSDILMRCKCLAEGPGHTMSAGGPDVPHGTLTALLAAEHCES